jgi:phenylpyruvate tautomerase PptA (4-oxalocrotonate tautomerase family)
LPLVTLSLEAGRTREQKRQLADGVYVALRAAIQIPENDRFVAIREHAARDLIADSGYLGVARSEHPVFVEITLRRGRATEKKQALYHELAERMSATGLVRAEDLLIVLHENGTADWSFGNGVAQYVEREQKEREQKEASQKQGQPMRAARMSEVRRSGC